MEITRSSLKVFKITWNHSWITTLKVPSQSELFFSIIYPKVTKLHCDITAIMLIINLNN